MMVFVMCGVVRSAMGRQTFSHTTQDEYATPVYAVNIILPHLEWSSFQRAWCPFDTNDSNYVKRLQEEGKTVHATHIQTGQDFLKYTPDFEYDFIVSNPPFSLKNEILAKCIALDKPFALLLPFTMFNSIKAVKTIKDSDIQFLIMDRRISFTGERPNFTCWYVCRKVLLNDNTVYTFGTDPRTLFKQEVLL